MKKLLFFPALIMTVAIVSCKKSEKVVFTPSANLNVTNAVVGGAALTLNTTSQTVNNNNYANFPLVAGQSQVNLYTSTTPAVTYYNQPLSVVNAANYSLFLAGASPSAVDAVLITENYKNYTDSLCGVRFINLSPSSNPISVNITGQANGSEVTSLAYKSYSNFKQYPAKSVNKTYSFQITDAGTGNLITSYNLNTPFFHNVTIVLRGIPGSQGVILVNHP